jgi:hypothetical protein
MGSRLLHQAHIPSPCFSSHLQLSPRPSYPVTSPVSFLPPTSHGSASCGSLVSGSNLRKLASLSQ